jgi:putative ABC transport system permease protein
MSDFWRDLRFGARTLRRAPGFTALTVAVLALGIGANSAIFSVVHAVLLRPLPYAQPERLFWLEEVDARGEAKGASPSDLAAFQPHVGQMALLAWQNFTLTGREGPENIYGERVSADGLAMLGTPPALGRVFRPRETDAVVISERLWRRRFGRSTGVLGRSLAMNGRAYTIVGVMPAEFAMVPRFEAWVPWQFTAAELANRDAGTTTIVRLRAGASPERARAELAAALAREGWTIRLTPLAEHYTGRVRPALTVALGAVMLVLLIACLNVANLLLARGAERHRELAVRAALGSGWLRIARQLLTESLLLAILGGAVGLAMGSMGARALVELFPERLPVPRLEQTRLDGAVVLFTLALSLATGLVFGLIPAVRAAGANLAASLKEGGRGAGNGATPARVRDALVVAETSLSLVLLIGAGLMLRSLDRLMRVDPGFDPDGVLTIRVPMPEGARAPGYTAMLERVGRMPGVESAGLIAPLPLANVDVNAPIAVEGYSAADGQRQLVKLRVASEGYFRAMGIRLRKGRLFRESDTAEARPVVIVNETLARRYFSDRDPIGTRVSMSAAGKGPFLEIAGVVEDAAGLDLGGKPEPEMYRDYRQFLCAGFALTLALRSHSGNPMQLAAAAQREIRAAAPDQPIGEVKSMRTVVSENIAQPRFYTLLLAVFAALSLALALSGLYGVLSHLVNQRAREMGIRMALGASGGAILRLVMGRALALVSVGMGLGVAASYGLTRLIAAQLFRTEATDLATFAGVSAALVAVAAAAAYVPARRAVKIDPVAAMRD